MILDSAKMVTLFSREKKNLFRRSPPRKARTSKAKGTYEISADPSHYFLLLSNIPFCLLPNRLFSANRTMRKSLNFHRNKSRGAESAKLYFEELDSMTTP